MCTSPWHRLFFKYFFNRRKICILFNSSHAMENVLLFCPFSKLLSSFIPKQQPGMTVVTTLVIDWTQLFSQTIHERQLFSKQIIPSKLIVHAVGPLILNTISGVICLMKSSFHSSLADFISDRISMNCHTFYADLSEWPVGFFVHRQFF